VSETFFAMFRRNSEPTERFADRLRDAAVTVMADASATDVVLFVDDGLVGAPPEATAYPSSYDGALLVTGVAPLTCPMPTSSIG